jgi:apolipoprotein D and lipocalin family protein
MKDCQFSWWQLLVIGVIITLLAFGLAYFYWVNRTSSHRYNLNGLKPVSPFEIQKYVSTPNNANTIWHEVARIPNSFESNLTNVTAEYLITSRGTVNVINTGFDKTTGKQSKITGTALVTPVPAALSVTFFPFFEAPYVIIYVDELYETAIVGDPNRSFLWFLGRGGALQTWTPAKTKALQQIALGAGYTQDQISAMELL